MTTYDLEAALENRRKYWAHLIEADKEVQIEAMQEWFYANYEDPAERTPYESKEGGYIWIWGGPYEAREELQDEFSGVVPDDVIEELADELGQECWEWAPAPKPEDYDPGIVDDIADISGYHANFQTAIAGVRTLLVTEAEPTAKQVLFRLLYVNVITALETYLSDAFIRTVVPNNSLMRRFIETTPVFRNRKIIVADVFKEMEKIEALAKAELADIVWHNLNRIKPLYASTLEITFPKDLEGIFKAIAVRHDLVHRNGKTKEGITINISEKDVEQLVEQVEAFVKCIDEQLPEEENDDLTLGYPDDPDVEF